MTAKLKFVLWGCLALLAIVGMQRLSSAYSLNDMREAINTYYWYIVTAYVLLICLRGLLFVPTMPVILLMASSLDSWLMFVITLSSTCCSSYLVCVAIDHLNMQKRLKALPGKSVKRAQRWIHNYGIAAIAGWAFFPLVFTELIVYLARFAGLPRQHIIAAVAVGEGLMIGIIIMVADWFTKILM